MQQVVKQLSERLFSAGHDITVATKYDSNRSTLLINGVKIEEFKISGKEVGGYDGDESEIQRYKNFLLNSDFDIVTNFAAQQWATDLALPILNQIKAKKVFVPTGFSELHNTKFKYYFDNMKQWMKGYDMNVFLSDNYQDINFARENEVKNIKVIPNGASAEEFVKDTSINIRQELKIPDSHQLILHVGSHTGLKGHKELIKIFKKAKVKNATLLIVGNSTHHGGKLSYLAKFLFKSIANLFSGLSGKLFFPSCFIPCMLKSFFYKISYDRIFNNKSLIIKDLSRKQTIAAYMEADIFLFPSNIECSPLVLFESMASKTPFLTTNVGNTEEIISWCNSGKLLKTTYFNSYSKADINWSAKELEKFSLDIEARKKMAQNGFDAFNDKFSWEKISNSYSELYQYLSKQTQFYNNSNLI
jgi:glycosyltransferase involved in cell wall biosynthesis